MSEPGEEAYAVFFYDVDLPSPGPCTEASGDPSTPVVVGCANTRVAVRIADAPYRRMLARTGRSEHLVAGPRDEAGEREGESLRRDFLTLHPTGILSADEVAELGPVRLEHVRRCPNRRTDPTVFQRCPCMLVLSRWRLLTTWPEVESGAGVELRRRLLQSHLVAHPPDTFESWEDVVVLCYLLDAPDDVPLVLAERELLASTSWSRLEVLDVVARWRSLDRLLLPPARAVLSTTVTADEDWLRCPDVVDHLRMLVATALAVTGTDLTRPPDATEGPAAAGPSAT